jgi:hypothetical protein
VEISGWYHHHEQNKNLEANIEQKYFWPLSFKVETENLVPPQAQITYKANLNCVTPKILTL